MKEVLEEKFGTLSDGTEVPLYVLENDLGDKVKLTPYGATLVAWQINENDELKDLVLGYDDVASYETNGGFLGATVGPIANRIAGAEFRINSKFYRNEKNEGNNALHSSVIGFSNVIWEVLKLEDHEISFKYILKTDKYPGELSVVVTYSYANDRQLNLDYEFESTEDTYVNLTNHSYFNVRGAGDVDDLFLEINADFYTPIDDTLMPTGEILKVEGSDFDLRKLRRLGELFASNEESIVKNNGLDHNYVLNKEEVEEFTYAMRLVDKDSKKQIVCFTDRPGIQVYTSNMLDPVKGSNNRVFSNHHAVCMETQFYPDAPNLTHFPSPKVLANTKYSSRTTYLYSDYIEE